MPDAADALADLKSHGFLLIVVTNQPDVARGTQRRDAVEQINKVLAICVAARPNPGLLPLWERMDATAESLPGLLVQAAREHQIDLARKLHGR